MLVDGANIQYFCTLVLRYALRQFDTLSSEVGGTKPENLSSIILGLDTYFFPVNTISKKSCDVPQNEESMRSKSKTSW